MKLKVGNYYKRRDGEIVGPLEFGDKDIPPDYYKISSEDGQDITYYESGHYYSEGEFSWDLVEEIDPQSDVDQLRVIIRFLTEERDAAKADNKKYHEDRQALSRQVELLKAEIKELRADPVIEKTTWALIGIDSDALVEFSNQDPEKHSSIPEGYTLLGHLRRDTYSDGRVVHVLEPLGEGGDL